MKFLCPNCGSVIEFPATSCAAQCGSLMRFSSPDPEGEGAVRSAATSTRLAGEIEQLRGTEKYRTATQHGANSSLMQGLIAPVLLDLGFDDERPQKVGLAAFRPDFMLSIPGDAVMVEVERGKTLDNNMDMLDMWKCHVHGETRHLILLVPVWYVKTSKTGKISRTPTYAKVCVRLSQFFRPGYYTNVRSLHVVGY